MYPGVKICTRCGEEKEVTEFYPDNRKEGRVHPICKKCWSERQKAYRSKRKEEISEKGKRYYEANKERINQRTRKWRQDNHEELMERQRIRRQDASTLLAQLKTPCVKCGESRNWVIQFHHIDPSVKSFELSVDTVSHKKVEIAKVEASKCACLCANCHTEFHYIYGKNPEDPVIDFENYLGGKNYDTVT